MTLQDRADAYARMFAQPASHLRVVRERGGDVLYGTWLIGNSYKATSSLYGSYPPGYLARVAALFPDLYGKGGASSAFTCPWTTLHVFSGSLPAGPYLRADVNSAREPDMVASVYDLPTIFCGRTPFGLVLADPPYSAADAEKYETAMVDRRRALAALAQVTRVGGFLVWLDCVWPMHRKAEWRTVGRIALIRSTNHRVRLVSIFQRAA